VCSKGSDVLLQSGQIVCSEGSDVLLQSGQIVCSEGSDVYCRVGKLCAVKVAMSTAEWAPFCAMNVGEVVLQGKQQT
jgi:hypothetical protein